jgi:hypothetical protein
VVDILSYDLTASDEVGKAINKTQSAVTRMQAFRGTDSGENPAEMKLKRGCR